MMWYKTQKEEANQVQYGNHEVSCEALELDACKILSPYDI